MSKERNFHSLQKLSTIGLLALHLLSEATIVEANDKLPKNCYASDGLVDLQHCSLYPWNIPLELLAKGYYGDGGMFIPGVPDVEQQSFNPGYFLTGSATYTKQGFMNGVLKERAEQWDLNPDLFIRAITLDSCAYIGATAWIRKGENGAWKGPYLVGDCAASIHQYERASNGLILEMDYLDFQEYQDHGRLDDMQVYIKPTSDLTPPPETVGTDPLPYASLWLEAADL